METMQLAITQDTVGRAIDVNVVSLDNECGLAVVSGMRAVDLR